MIVPLLVVATLLAWRNWRPAASRLRGQAPADSLSALDPKSAYLRGIDRVRAGRHSEALPYFRHALALRGDLWQVHADYAAGLLNTTMEVAPHRGLPGPVSRSSWERLIAIREALDRLNSAQRLVHEPRDRATVLSLRSNLYANWGLFWDSGVEYRRALEANPSLPRAQPAPARSNSAR